MTVWASHEPGETMEGPDEEVTKEVNQEQEFVSVGQNPAQIL